MKARFFGGLIWCVGLTAQAGPFQLAFEAALQHDAGFRAASADLASVQQNVPLARAQILPSVSASLSNTRVHGTRSISDNLGQTSDSALDYRAPVYSLTVRAPLFDRDGMQKLRLAHAQASYAQTVFAASKVELLERLAKAYLQRLMSEQALVHATAQVASAQSQQELAQRAQQLGEGTRPDALDAQASSELAKVLWQDAQNQLQIDKLALQQITGLYAELPDRLTDQYSRGLTIAPIAPAMPTLAELMAQAERQNPSLLARKQAVELAQIAVTRSGAGHYPRLDLVASVTNARNESLSTLNQSINQRSVGLQLNVPLYSGGYVGALVTQAMANLDKAQAELEATQRAVALDVTQYYLARANGLAKIEARQRAVEASQLALKASEKGLSAGFNTRIDVTQSQLKLEQSRRELAQTVIEYVLANFRLATRIGTDTAEIAASLDSLLVFPGQ